MATVVRNGDRARDLSIRELIGEITEKASMLVRTEAKLAKAEIKADLNAELAMAKSLAIAFVAALTGVNLLLVALVLGLATWMPGWLAALIVAGVVLGPGVVIGYVGWRRRVTNPLVLTRKTLKEDVQWAKERLA